MSDKISEMLKAPDFEQRAQLFVHQANRDLARLKLDFCEVVNHTLNTADQSSQIDPGYADFLKNRGEDPQKMQSRRNRHIHQAVQDSDTLNDVYLHCHQVGNTAEDEQKIQSAKEIIEPLIKKYKGQKNSEEIGSDPPEEGGYSYIATITFS